MSNSQSKVSQIVQYYNSISVKTCFRPWLKEDLPVPEIDSILALNQDMEPYVLQSSARRTRLLADTDTKILQFIHFSDIHAVRELWDRIVEYANAHDSLSFLLHTGDYCADSQAEHLDLYEVGLPCRLPILNCIGNHDTVDADRVNHGKHTAWEKTFTHTENWDVVFCDLPDSMTYYRDFSVSHVRLIVLDQYFDLDAQCVWLRRILQDAREKGLHVLTAMHQPSGHITEKIDTAFHTPTDFEPDPETPFDAILGEFIRSGGIHICNLAGHTHSDRFGFTQNGVLNVVVECACDWAGWCDSLRPRGSRAYDCFNVTSIDTDLSLLKLVRIGDQVDYALRTKRALCWDYRNRKLISSL